MAVKSKISRRDLIKTGAIAGAAAAAGGLAAPNLASAQAQALPTRWDREADVVRDAVRINLTYGRDAR
jgi:anaerobic selenocysteine-containing dehydrogenase